jgi:hypothetical protein
LIGIHGISVDLQLITTVELVNINTTFGMAIIVNFVEPCLDKAGTWAEKVNIRLSAGSLAVLPRHITPTCRQFIAVVSTGYMYLTNTPKETCPFSMLDGYLVRDNSHVLSLLFSLSTPEKCMIDDDLPPQQAETIRIFGRRISLPRASSSFSTIGSRNPASGT